MGKTWQAVALLALAVVTQAETDVPQASRGLVVTLDKEKDVEKRLSRDTVVTLDTNKWLRLTADKFLSLSVSPELLLTNDNYSTTTISMLQALAPAYLRVGGPETKRMVFKMPSNSSKGIVFNETEWDNLNELAIVTGMSLIYCLNPSFRGHDAWDLLRLSVARGYNPAWQLGYEMKDGEQVNGTEFAVDILRLRKMLDSFPQYQNTAILGPDLGPEVEREGFLNDAGDLINIVSLQVKPQTQEQMTDKDDTSKKLSEIIGKATTVPSNRRVEIVNEKNKLKRFIWLAESADEGYTGEFEDAIAWALRLGMAARLGYQVVLRHPAQLTQPAPDYWVSLLHRNLVGRAVLNTKLLSSPSALTVFAHCTASDERPNISLLETEAYNRGAVTLWGVNTGQDSARLTLRGTSRQHHAHLYTLTQDSWEEAEPGNTLLNGQLLYLTDGLLPSLSPQVQPTGRSLSVSVRVPARSVFFIVLPDMRARACLSYPHMSAREELVNMHPPEKSIRIKFLSDIAPFPTRREDDGSHVFEKGWIYESSEEDDDSSETIDRMKPQTKSANLGERLLNLLKTAEEKIFQKKTAVLKDNINEDNTSNEASKNKHYQLKKISEKTDKSTESEFSEKAITSSEQTNSNRPPDRIDDVESVDAFVSNRRLKRSENENGYVLLENTEIPRPLHMYRRINFLRRNRQTPEVPIELKMVTPESVQQLHKTSSIAESTSETAKEHDIHMSTSNHLINKFRINDNTNIRTKEHDRIHYLPGEFYQTLGGFKLDSNVSLRDIEDPNEAIASIIKEMSANRAIDSRLQVSKKDVNEHLVDRKVIKNATGQMKRYYGQKENLNKSIDDLNNDEVKGKESSSGSGEKVVSDDQVSKSNISNKTNNKPNKSLYQTPKTILNNYNENSRFEIPINRMKREIGAQHELDTSHIILHSSEFNEEVNSTKPNDSEEKDLTLLLDELTSEGEQLLKSLDAHKKETAFEPQDIPEQSTIITTTAEMNEEDNTENERIYLSDENIKPDDLYKKNNQVVENRPRRKKKYLRAGDEPSSFNIHKNINLMDENNSEYANAITDNEANLNGDTIEIEPDEITADMGLKSEIKEKIDKAIVEAIKEEINEAIKIKEVSSPTESTTLRTELVFEHEEDEKDIQNYADYKLNSKNEEMKETKTQDENVSLSIGENEKNIKHKDVMLTSKYTEINEPALNILEGSVKEQSNDKTQDVINPIITSGQESDTTDKPFEFEDIKNINKPNESILISKIVQATSTPLPIINVFGSTDKSISEEEGKPTKFSSLAIKPSLRLNNRQLPIPLLGISAPKITLPTSLNNMGRRLKINSSIQKQNDSPTEATRILNLLSEEHKKRLEAFRERLEKTRERLLNLSKSKTTLPLLPVKLIAKRAISYNLAGFNDLQKASWKYDVERTEPTVGSDLEKGLIPQHMGADTVKGKTKSLLKIIIEGAKSKDSRKRRHIQYPCIRDRFNDYETIGQKSNSFKMSNDEGKNIGSEYSISKDKRNSETNGKSPLLIHIPLVHLNKPKRSIHNNIERNEVMRAIITNDIVKEKPAHSSSEQMQKGSAFKTMLHKTLSKSASNKTGIEKMLELAKEYQKTNPNSLEIYGSNEHKNKNKFARKTLEENEDEDKETEVTDVGNTESKIKHNVNDNDTSSDSKSDRTPIKKPTLENHTKLKSVTHDENSNDSAMSTILSDIQTLFHGITKTIKETVS